MLSVIDIYSNLCKEQEYIDMYYSKIHNFEKKEKNDDTYILSHILDKNESDLPHCFEIIFDKNIINYYYDNTNDNINNKSLIFSLFNSILNIGDAIFNLYDNSNKELIITLFFKQLDNNLFKKGLYNKFKYNKQFDKYEIQQVLKNELKFESYDKINILKKYLVDYLGINLYIFKIENEVINFDNSEYYLNKQYNNKINRFLPHFVLLYDDKMYKPLLMHNKSLNNSSILTYSNNKDVIDNIWELLKIKESIEKPIEKPIEKLIEKPIEKPIEKLIEKPIEKLIEKLIEKPIEKPIEKLIEKPIEKLIEKLNEKPIETSSKYTLTFLKNLKINFIKKLCEENNILLQKKSEKTSNLINKLKNELIQELLIL